MHRSPPAGWIKQRGSTSGRRACSTIKSDFNRVIHSVNYLLSEVSRAELAPNGAGTAQNPSAPPGYPQLWISCGYRGVVKWITFRPWTAGRKRRLRHTPGMPFHQPAAPATLIHRQSTLLITRGP